MRVEAVRVHQHGATPLRDTGDLSNDKKFGEELADHAIGRCCGGLTTENHLVCDWKGRALVFITPMAVVRWLPPWERVSPASWPITRSAIDGNWTSCALLSGPRADGVSELG